ncbi:MAG TPA: glycosyl hydrolase [bacterium]|nr:glycosyl hydrolase [bacterium]
MGGWCLVGFLTVFLTVANVLDARAADIPKNAASSKQDAGGVFGINGVGAFHQRHALQGDVLRRISNLKQLGIRWDRSDFWWHVLEPREGEFDWSFSDALLDLYDQHDLQIFPILCYSSAWARGDGFAPANELEWKQFANFTFEAVNRYKDRIRYWEIWNEPNILPFWRPQPDVEDYTRLLKEAYKAAKRADPNCIVVGMCTAGFDLKFIERAYQLGARDYFDVLSCHYYLTGEPEQAIKRDLQNLRHLMTRYGDSDKKVWITEMGVTSHPNRKHGVSEQQQANLLVRNYLSNLATGLVEKIFWFCLVDWTDNPDDERWDSYLGLLRYDRSEKPSFEACRNLATWLDGAEYVGDPRLDGKVHSWLWKKGEDLILIACTSGESVDLMLPTAHSSLKHHGLFGETQTIDGLEDGNAHCTINETPACFVGISESLLLRTSFRFCPDSLTLQPEETVKAQLVFLNPFREKIKARLSIESPKGWKVRCPRSLTLAPQAERRVSVTLRAPSDSIARDHTIRTTLEIQGDELSEAASSSFPLPMEATLRAVVSDAVSLRLRPIIDQDQIVTTLEVASHLTNPSMCDLSMRFPWKSEKTRKTVPAGEQIRWECRSSLAELRNMRITEPIVAGVKIARKPHPIEKRFNIAVIPLVESSSWSRDPEKPTVSLRQVHALTGIGSESDFTSDVWLAFSKQSLLVCARFHDCTPAQNPFDGEDIWKGDSLEIYLGFGGPEERPYFSPRDFQMLVSPGIRGENAQIFSFPQKRKISEAQISVDLFDSGCEIKAEIPLSVFGEPGVESGQIIGLDVAAHDYSPDRQPEMQALMWNGTGANWLTPRDWGIGVIR